MQGLKVPWNHSSKGRIAIYEVAGSGSIPEWFAHYFKFLMIMYSMTKMDSAYTAALEAEMDSFKDLKTIIDLLLTAFGVGATTQKQMQWVCKLLSKLYPCEPVKVVVATNKLNKLAAKAMYSFSFGDDHKITMPNWEGDARNLFNFFHQVGHQLHTGQNHSYAFDNNIQRTDHDRNADRTKQCDLFAAWALTHFAGAAVAMAEYAKCCNYQLLIGYNKPTEKQIMQQLRYAKFKTFDESATRIQ
jgi:hypothetical protein